MNERWRLGKRLRRERNNMGKTVIIAGVRAYGHYFWWRYTLRLSIDVFDQMKQLSRNPLFDALNCCLTLYIRHR